MPYRLLFSIHNIDNVIVEDQSDIALSAMKPSQINKQVIGQLNVLQIAKLVNSGRLSRGLISQFIGFDRSVGEFISTFQSIDFSELCTVDNLHLLVQVCKLFKAFAVNCPGENSHWMSTVVYHTTAILDLLSKNNVDLPEFFNTCHQILDNLSKSDLHQCAAFVEQDDLKSAGIKRNQLRLQYPHTSLTESYELYHQQASLAQQNLSIWKPSGEEDLKKALCKVYFSLSNQKEPEDGSIEELVNNFDVESVRIWPFMMNLLAQTLSNIDTSSQSVVALGKFLSNMSALQQFLPPLPCNLQERVEELLVGDNVSGKLITIFDWVSYVIGQGQLNQIIASCNYQFDNDSDEYSVGLDFTTSFTQVNILDFLICYVEVWDVLISCCWDISGRFCW